LETISLLTDDFSDASLTDNEEELMDIITDGLRKKPKFQNHRFLDVGEIDLLYYFGASNTAKLTSGIINIELKVTKNSETRFIMVCRQAKKYGKVMHLLTGMPVYSCAATEHGLTLVKKYTGRDMNKVQNSQLDEAFLNFMERIAVRDVLEKRVLYLNAKRKLRQQKKTKSS
jgi:hypothetical protein